MIFRAIMAFTFLVFLAFTGCDDEEDANVPMVQGTIKDANGVGISGAELHFIYEIDSSSVSVINSPPQQRTPSFALDGAVLEFWDVVPSDRAVWVLWDTASEINCEYFKILRNNELRGTYPAWGDSSGHIYSYLDDCRNGVTYTYALESVDNDGAHQLLFSDTVTPRAEYGTRLNQNYPNPVQDSTSILVHATDTVFVALKVYRTDETEIATLLNGAIPAGDCIVCFNAESLTNGFYEYRLEAGNIYSDQRILLKNTEDVEALRLVPGITSTTNNGQFEFNLSAGDSVAVTYDMYYPYSLTKPLQRAKIVALAEGYEPADTTISLSRGMHHILTFVLAMQ
jgi:hypothetical protein